MRAGRPIRPVRALRDERPALRLSGSTDGGALGCGPIVGEPRPNRRPNPSTRGTSHPRSPPQSPPTPAHHASPHAHPPPLRPAHPAPLRPLHHPHSGPAQPAVIATLPLRTHHITPQHPFTPNPVRSLIEPPAGPRASHHQAHTRACRAAPRLAFLFFIQHPLPPPLLRHQPLLDSLPFLIPRWPDYARNLPTPHPPSPTPTSPHTPLYLEHLRTREPQHPQ